MKKNFYISLIIMALGTSCQQKETLVYPAAERENVTDKYFDTEVADPYRWLENDTAAATAAWVEAENRVTEAYLSKIPYRNKLRERLTELNDYEKIGTPFVKNGKYYFFKNDGLQNQSVLYVADNADDVTAGRALPLLDPNKFSDDGTVALGTISFSNDGKYLAYSVSQSGSDWKEIYVMDLNTKQLTSDKIQWAKSTDISWLKDGFFYSAFDAPSEKGKEYSNVNENHKIYYHKVGTPQADDKLYYANPKFPKRFYSAAVPEEENAVFIYEAGANNGNRLFIDANLFFDSKKMPIQEIASDDQFEYAVVEVVGRFFYVLTNYNAPKYRLMVGDIRMPEIKNWSDVLPETENVLTSVDFTNGKIIAVYDKDATHRAYVYSTEGKLENEIALPTYGSVGFSTNKNEKDIFYAFTSFTFPNTIYKYDISANKSDVYIEPKVKFNPEDYQTEQHFYASKDGTRIPLYLVYKKGLAKNGKNPALLYGYGGFNITYRPSFSTSRIPFLDCGGVYAIANIRGGGEYGEEWHIAGTKMQKQNVFDDFIAAGEYLISEKYTSKEKLACIGGSNGGLLVGAVVNQRPDLWRVAIPEVGVMDMLRYHLFTIGWNWASDYGRSDDSREMFEYLKAYSPLHNIKNDGTPYPAILITTADHDDRVVPAHSFKYAAQLQASDTGSAPKLIRIESKAGHGGGKPLTKQIDELTDIYSFIFYNLGMRF